MSTRKKYTKEFLAPFVQQSTNYSNLLRNLGLQLTGGNQQNIKSRIEEHQLDITHFVHGNFGHIGCRKKSAEEILIYDPHLKRRLDPKQLRRALQEKGRKKQCAWCDLKEVWNNKFIRLEIDHIDGDWKNNKLENLRCLCPNCHSQTPNYYHTKVVNKPPKYFCEQCSKPVSKKNVLCKKCSAMRGRTAVRPSHADLLKLLSSSNYTQVAKKFGVSDTTIKKWSKGY